MVGGTSAGATSMCTVSHQWRDAGMEPKVKGVGLAVPAPCIISALPEGLRKREGSWEQNRHAKLFDVETSE